MIAKKLFKITISDADKTVLYFAAESKVKAILMFSEHLTELGKEIDDLPEDFHVSFIDNVYVKE